MMLGSLFEVGQASFDEEMALFFCFSEVLKGFGVIGPWFAMGRSLFVKLLGRASFFSLVCFPFD